jgi:hypothetical protein
MKLSEHIIKEAKEIVTNGSPLPQQITSAPHFYVAEETDESVIAFNAIEHDGSVYKIGTKKVVH